ncbi:YAP1-binding protein 1 [Recurvomyces mirabilis]|uniref:YAP1-binding protein 1 n=1 Tax=Recurvomyces mirabilis TaxID=574656 RepID=A0AAE1C6P2_9PEZI|nr:YAP1-binding protein 1 [Recurvomyces mirabilis]KAK5162241.1 YAP1-binding protein 1 [Recurvomyces mirabilis]
MADSESPLLKALPPETDYITYLTIIEYNLTQENLPILHKVLQDEKLTTNIGWDLVHLLVPFLPESEQCLQDIARLGNPREVILKVTESLRLIEYELPDDDETVNRIANALGDASDSRARAESTTYPTKTAATTEGEKQPGSSQMVEIPPPLPLAVNQFVALLSMLATLHPRIKTKYPSRFLSTTLQAILASLSNTVSHREEMVLAVIKMTKSFTGVQRPMLPSRKSSGMVRLSTRASARSAPDPEASTTGEVAPEESAMQRKLLQSFVTHVIEEYMLILTSESEDIPGMAWCSRIMEKCQPERTIPGAPTMADRFQSDEKLHGRVDVIGQLATLAQDLKLDDEVLLQTISAVEKTKVGSGQEEDDPPNSADDIPLSRVGSLFLLAARQVSGVLYEPSSKVSSSGVHVSDFDVFPDHQEVLKHCLSTPAQGTGTLGTEPEALIDATLALGLICLEHDAIGEPKTDEQFTEYLQVIALLSSNCPSPNLRGHAHYLTSTVLRSQPDDKVRLAFIRDTLEHCPFENLKVSAVGWIKGETIEANPPAPIAGHTGHAETGTTTSVFATPLALDSLAPYLFPSLEADLLRAPVADAWQTLQLNLSFYLTALNFLFLLLSARHLHRGLEIADMWRDNDVAGSFLQPLRDAEKRFSKGIDEGGELAEERTNGVVAELLLLNETMDRVTKAVRYLNGL